MVLHRNASFTPGNSISFAVVRVSVVFSEVLRCSCVICMLLTALQRLPTDLKHTINFVIEKYQSVVHLTAPGGFTPRGLGETYLITDWALLVVTVTNLALFSTVLSMQGT